MHAKLSKGKVFPREKKRAELTKNSKRQHRVSLHDAMLMFTIAAPPLHHIPGLHYVHCCQSMFAISAVGWSSTKLAPTTGNNSLQPTSFGLMQEDHQQEPYYLRDQLLKTVDADCNVRDVPLMLEVLGKLESLPVTKEVLESTRLGKTVNELRRKVKDAVLARRLKDLVKKWREQVLVNDPPHQNHQSVNGASSSSSIPPGGDGGHGPGTVGNRAALISGYTSASSSPTLGASSSSRVSPAGSYNSNSLSPRIGPMMTNYSNNTSAHHHHHHQLSLPVSRNGSSSIGSSRSPNNHHNRNLHQQITSAMVSPSASASPHLIPRNLISPHKSRSPGGPILTAFNSNNLSPLPSSQFQSTSSSYAPNVETISRTNVANKRYREADDTTNSLNTEPPQKRSRSAVNGTLDDPLLALDDISRDSYHSRGSDHSDGFQSKEHRFSSSTLSPATPGQTANLSPQMPVQGGGTESISNVPSPVALQDLEITTASQTETKPKKKRRRKQNEFYQDNEAILREKIAQAEAEKASRQREAKEKEAAMALAQAQAPGLGSDQDVVGVTKGPFFEETLPEDTIANNEFVETYLKSQNELRAKMERDAVDILSGEGADDPITPSQNFKGKKQQKNKPKAAGGELEGSSGVDSTSFPTESEILAKLPPIDPAILKEFANFEYDVNPSPPQAQEEKVEGGESQLLNKETESTALQSLSTTVDKPPPKFIDWGDSEDEMDDVKPSASPPPPEDTVQIKSEPPVPDNSQHTPTPTPTLENEEEEPEPGLVVGLSSATLPFHREHVEESEVESYVTQHIPNLNGNWDKDGEFKEWQETLTVESYKQEPLHILPYTIIDF